MTHDCYRARGWVGWASKGSQKRRFRLVLCLSATQHRQDAAVAFYCLLLQTTLLYRRKVCSLHGPLALIGGPGPRLGWNREAQNLA